jgi:aminoglycoside phosphotransferase
MSPASYRTAPPRITRLAGIHAVDNPNRWVGRKSETLMSDVQPQTLWPQFTGWTSTGWKEGVLRARDQAGATVYVRPDDGSAPLLRSLAMTMDVPVPSITDSKDGWLVLAALPGIAMEDASWAQRPDAAIAIVVSALQVLWAADVTHGDLCLPNILGDPDTGQLTGIIDWTHANRFSREVDLGAVTWSWELDHPSLHPSGEIEVLQGIGWPRCDADEVDRLTAFWLANGYWND